VGCKGNDITYANAKVGISQNRRSSFTYPPWRPIGDSLHQPYESSLPDDIL
jgi:hypothetical protein